MLCAIDLSLDLLLAHQSIDRTNIDRWRCANDGWSCTIDHPLPSSDDCTVRHVDD